MDATQEQAAVDTAQANYDNLQTQLTAAGEVLTSAKAALANVGLINTLEEKGKDPEAFATLQSELQNDPDNTSGIIVSLPIPDTAIQDPNA